MNLSILIILPLITTFAILFVKGLKQVRTVALIGSAAQFLLSLDLLFVYWKERAAGNTTQFLFDFDYTWFAPLNIHYHIGFFCCNCRCIGFLDTGNIEQGIFLSLIILKCWRLRLFYFVGYFYFILLFRSSSDT